MQTTRAFSSRAAAPLKASAPVRVGRPGRAARLVVEARQFRKAMGVLGTKAGMMSFFTPDGLCVPATVIALEEGNIVTQVKTEDTDGYNAVQVGYKVVVERKVTKPVLGHLQKAGVAPVKRMVEFKVRRAAAAAAARRRDGSRERKWKRSACHALGAGRSGEGGPAPQGVALLAAAACVVPRAGEGGRGGGAGCTAAAGRPHG